MNTITLDSYDHALISALRDDATQTNADLASHVNLSASQCSRRRAKLEKTGIITGYGARLNYGAIGLGLTAVTRVNLSSHGEAAAENFARYVARHDDIQSAFSVSGDADYVLIICTRDLETFAAFIHRHLLPQDNVTQVRSEIVLMTLKDNS